ncbi:MAG: hypothetical protein ACK50E_04440, partial [Bacteroidota bacterium]
GTISGITKSMIGLGNCDNTSDTNKPISSATQTALNLKADSSALSSYATTSSLSSYATLSNPTFTGYIQTPRIFENIQSSYTSFSSNVLTYDYANGSILFFSGLTSATNFQLVLNNINPNTQTNKSFTFTLIIDTATYKAYANTFKIGSTSYTLNASGGLANVSVNASATTVLQSFTIIYTSSSSTPYKVITNVISYY